MKYLLFAVTLFSLISFGQIDPKHTGKFECTCTHEYCDQQLGVRTTIQITPQTDNLTIEYTDETHSGAPAKVVDKATGFTTYQLASGARAGFTADGTFSFGRGKLWTCAPKN